MDTVTATKTPPTASSLPTTGGSSTVPLVVAGAALATGLAARAIVDDHRR
jgi:LPXTG-motif cell wall-anchored protein